MFPSYEDHLERMSQVMCKRISPILKYSNIVKTARPPVTYYPLKIYRKIFPIEQLKPEVNHVSLAFFEFVNSDS